MHARVRRLFAFGLPVALLPVSCGTSPAPIAKLPEVTAGDEQQATCKVAKDPLNPMIVEWPGMSKSALDGASQRGVVVVSYAGCVLKVLASCTAGGSYEFTGLTPVHDKLSIENESDLYAKLPLGVASLKGELNTSGKLELDYVVVGERATMKPPASLQGDCAGATHYVRTITVGAYSLDAIGKATATGSVEVAGRGAGGEHDESVRHVRDSGPPVNKCRSDGATSPECRAVLQLGLAPLSVGGGGAVTSGGFGAGLGAVAAVPVVQEITTLPSGAASLAGADVALLGLLQEAKRADKGSAAATDKATAWGKLAAYTGNNPYKEMAEKRGADWTSAAEAEVRHKEQVAKVCAQYAADKAKLGQLLAMDDDVVTPQQKSAYRSELGQVYMPFRAVVKECPEYAQWQAREMERGIAEVQAQAQRMARAQAQATAQTPTAARATAQAQVRATQAEAEAANSFTAAGRVWKKEPAERTMNWADAKAHCARPWRLPSKDELVALYHGGFVDSEDGPYWSSSVPDNPPGWATYVNVRGFALDQQTYAWLRVRCVR